MWVHRLSNIDELDRTADCANCGRVKITKKSHKKDGKPGYRCYVASYTNKIELLYGEKIKEKSLRCVVCGSRSRIVYDHSHATGLFRGWLCNACNVALGLVRDDPVRLRALAEYLEKGN